MYPKLVVSGLSWTTKTCHSRCLLAWESQVLTKDSESTIEIELINILRPWLSKNEIQVSPQLYLAFVIIIVTFSILLSRLVVQTWQNHYLSCANDGFCYLYFSIAPPIYSTGHGFQWTYYFNYNCYIPKMTTSGLV